MLWQDNAAFLISNDDHSGIIPHNRGWVKEQASDAAEDRGNFPCHSAQAVTFGAQDGIKGRIICRRRQRRLGHAQEIPVLESGPSRCATSSLVVFPSLGLLVAAADPGCPLVF